MHGRVALVTGGSGGIGAELSIRLAAELSVRLAAELSVRLAADGVTGNAIAPALIADTAMLPGDPGELAAGFRSASSPRCSRATPASSPPHSRRRVHRDAPERPRRARRRVPVGEFTGMLPSDPGELAAEFRSAASAGPRRSPT